MKNRFKLLLMLTGYIGFSQSETVTKSKSTVTFPNGDESIVITKGKQEIMLSLRSNNQTSRFEELKLSNHEVVHEKELPGLNPELDSLARIRGAYSLYRKEEEETGAKSPDPGSES